MSRSTSFKWPLAVSSFTLWDKLKIAAWLIRNDRFTMGSKVEDLERLMGEYAGAHALMLSSGSAANQLVFELWKVKNDCQSAVVHCPAVTWISSLSPAMMASLTVKLCDINLDDFSFDYEMLERHLKEHAGRRQIIWPTALIGFVPDMPRLKTLAKTYGAELYLDSCENTFSPGILSSCDITTTSTYFSHQVVSVEGGFCFFQDERDFKLAKMFRNHGLSRSLPALDPIRREIEAANPEIDPSFLFAMAGTNLRPTDIHAMFGLTDMRRIPEATRHRKEIYKTFKATLDKHLYYLPGHKDHIGFCLPIFRRDGQISRVKAALAEYDIETRPIIGGNLSRQPPFKGYGDPKDFPNAEWVHTHGCYVGLHQGVTPFMAWNLADELNKLDAEVVVPKP